MSREKGRRESGKRKGVSREKSRRESGKRTAFQSSTLELCFRMRLHDERVRGDVNRMTRQDDTA